MTFARQAWLRLTTAFGLVVVIFIAGSWVAVPGVNREIFIDAARCGEEHFGFYMWPVLCRGSYQPLGLEHLGGGYLAIVVGGVFVALWLRSRLELRRRRSG